MATKRASTRPTRKKRRTTCLNCKGPLPPIALGTDTAADGKLHADDYCSTGCARIGYGTAETREKLT